MNVLNKPLRVAACGVLTCFLALNSIFLKYEKVTAICETAPQKGNETVLSFLLRVLNYRYGRSGRRNMSYF